MNQRNKALGYTLLAVLVATLVLTLTPVIVEAGDNLDAPGDNVIYDLFWDQRTFDGTVGFPGFVGWSHNPAGMPGALDQTEFENSVEASFNIWEAVDDGLVEEPLVPIVNFIGTTTASAASPDGAALDGINAVIWVAGTPGGVLATTPCYRLSAPTVTEDDGNGNTVMNFVGGPTIPFPGPIGVTYPTGTLIDCGIEFDSADSWSTNAGPQVGAFDVVSVATHEIGHFLGLSHSTVGNLTGIDSVSATMAPFGTSNNIELRSLQEDDTASLLRTYARNAISPVPQTAGGRGVIQFDLRKGGACLAATGVSVWAYRTSEGLLGANRVETFSGSEFRQGIGDEPFNGSVTLNVPPLPPGDSYTIFARTLENNSTSSAGAFSAYRYNFTTINSNSLEPDGQSRTFDNLAVVNAIAPGAIFDLGVVGIDGCWADIPGSSFDLAAQSVTVPAEGTLGSQIAVTSSFTNQGAATGPFEVGIYFSTDATINAADVFSGFTCGFAGLAIGGNGTCDGMVNVPSLPLGDYYVGLLVDRQNEVGESDESNNGIASLTTTAIVSNPLDPIVNGSFETGDLSGWTVKELDETSSNPFLKLTVDGAGVEYPAPTIPYLCGFSVCNIDFFASEPTDGTYAALHDWNGDDSTTTAPGGGPEINLRELYQEVSLPIQATTLTFDYRAAWELFRFGATVPRTFSVVIEPAGGGTPLINDLVLPALLGLEEDTENPSGEPGQSYPPGVVDISAVAGQDVRIKFVWDVPEPGTGFAFFQLDNIRVNTLPNTAPVVTITAPTNGSNFDSGASVAFTGGASDGEDGDISANLNWSSSLDGVIGGGSGFSTGTLSSGVHTITASATDSGSLSGSDSISVTIGPAANTAPVVTITAPGQGASFTVGDTINFTGTASDDIDGNISVSLSWSSDIGGVLGTGAGVSTSSLAVGTHAITASVTDSGGLLGTDSITVTINDVLPTSDVMNFATSDFATSRGAIVAGTSYLDTALLDGAPEVLREAQQGKNASKSKSLLDHTWTFTVAPGASYQFLVEASRTDSDEGDDFVFAYSLDNASFTDMVTVASTAPTTETYAFTTDVAGTVYVRVQDTDRTRGASQLDELSVDWMTIVSVVGAGGNTAPVVSITTPSAPATATVGDSITFAGMATDTQDGDVTASLSWTSSLDGAIGGGPGFSTMSLSVGNHTITASVTDSGGLPGSASIGVTVNAVGGGDPISLSANGYKVKGVQHADLSWTGTSQEVDIHLDGGVIDSVASGTSYTDNIGVKGGGHTYVYQVCIADGGTCSNTATVVF